MKTGNFKELEQIIQGFAIKGQLCGLEPFKSGHINQTYRSVWREDGVEKRFIHQRINHDVFRDVELLMANIALVTEHLAKAFAQGKGEPGERTLQLVPTRSRGSFLHDAQHGYWRTYVFVEGMENFDVCPDSVHAFQAARALGRFVALLRDIDIARIKEPILRFQDSRYRYEDFDAAIKQNKAGRIASVREEIDFAETQRVLACTLIDSLRAGKIPLRLTHADPKFNNVLFDSATKQAACIVDLDTCMPGTILYDFGDLVRSTAVPAAEDERDLSKVHMSMEYFEALVKGYLEATYTFVTREEVELFAIAPRALAITLGVRFLTDYLNGDTYFRVHREGHNLDRARAQFQIARSMSAQESKMRELVQRYGRGKS
ncbi:MAG: aminoglycoside phosphotransferase family protein [Oligoflexia bacterium]|nr:aminoglycoside phosphotransferase family protein [Oligoflexia bacterium]